MESSLQTNTLNPSSQNTTQNPQLAGTSSNNVAHASGVQPGTASSVLESVNGIPLNITSLPSVSLSASTTSNVSSSPHALPKHHVNSALLVIAALIIVVAVVSFWSVGRSVKNTT